MKKLLFSALLAATTCASFAQTYYTYYEVRDADNGALLNNYPIKFLYTNGGLAGLYDIQNTGLDPVYPGWVTFFGPSTSQCGNAMVAVPHASIISGIPSSCMTGANHYITVRNTKATNFLVNGTSISTNSATPTLICRINNGPVTFNNNSSWSGIITGSTFSIYNSVGTLISTNTYGSGGAPSAIELTQSGFIGSASGTFRLVLSNTFSGGTVISYTGYVNVTDVTGSVDFVFNAPGGTTVPSNGTPVIGATSGGINSPTSTVTGTTPTNYSITILQGSTVLGTVSSATPLTGSYNLNSITAGYFISNYSTYIGSNPTFTARFTVSTPCGVFTKECNFKINSTSQWLRGVAQLDQIEDVVIAPNPASSQINVKWYEKAEDTGDAQLILTDVMGKKVVQKTWTVLKGSNEETVDIAGLSNGIYYYQLIKGSQVTKGALVKQ